MLDVVLSSKKLCPQRKIGTHFLRLPSYFWLWMFVLISIFVSIWDKNLDFEQLEDSNRVPCSIFRWEQNRAAVLVQFSCKALKQDHLCDILFCKYSVIFLFCKNSVTFFFCKYSVIFVFCKYSVTFIFFFLSSLNFEFVCSPISPL